MTIDPDMLPAFRKAYFAKRGEVAQVVAEAMVQAYKAVTGKAPSDKLIEALIEVAEQELR